MNYQFFPSLFVRNPLYSFSRYQSEKATLIEENIFHMGIFLASKCFYKEIKRNWGHLNSLAERQNSSLKKYLNRACFRPTPFGLFSTVSVADWIDGTENGIKLDIVEADFKLDFGIFYTILKNMDQEKLKQDGLFKSNDTLYKIGSNWRYVKKGQFSLAGEHLSIESIKGNILIDGIIDYCRQPKKIEDIRGNIKSIISGEDNIVNDFINELLDSQIFQSVHAPNITGRDCLDFFIELCRLTPESEYLLTKLEKMNKLLANINPGDIDKIFEVENTVNELQPDHKAKQNNFYVVSHRKVLSGGISKHIQGQILEGLNCLNKLLPYCEIERFADFRKRFQKKFGNLEVQLLEALDPEVGVGYESDNIIPFELFQGFADKEEILNETNQRILWTQAHAMILEKWHSRIGDTKKEIVIEDTDLQRLRPEGYFKLPPSFSVMFRILGDKLLIEEAGGVTATALIGRFSVLGSRFEESCKQVVKVEELNNPNVIFAELINNDDPHTANINRRATFRDYEIPVLSTSLLDSDHQIPLSDLLISIHEDEIILRSKNLKTRIMPRLGSAYNFNKSNIPVFRFLCDLQYQGIKSSFKLDMPYFFPDLPFYPRVMYKSCILHLACWHLSKDDLNLLSRTDIINREVEFLRLKNKLKLPRYIGVCEQDNQIVFDLECDDDVKLLIDHLQGKDKAVLKEFPDIDSGGPFAESKSGLPLISQYVASLYHEGGIYPTINLLNNGIQRNDKNLFAGKCWLFLKIYCHVVSANSLISKHITPVLLKLEKEKQIGKWYFVRYNDPEHHLRLRVETKPDYTDSIHTSLNGNLVRLMRQSIIENYTVEPYQREIERYPVYLIAEVEKVFHCSSKMTAFFLKRCDLSANGSPFMYLDFVRMSLMMMFDGFGIGLDERIELLKILYEGLFKEFGCTNVVKKALDKRYTEVRDQLGRQYCETLQIGSFGLKQLSRELNNSCRKLLYEWRVKQKPTLEKLVADMIHMHLNRLFATEARKQEMSAYYLLYRHYMAQKYTPSSLNRSANGCF